MVKYSSLLTDLNHFAGCQRGNNLCQVSRNTDIFSFDSAAKLPKYTGINDYLINLINDKQLPYDLIYSQKLVKLEILKTYIKTNLANGFIRSSKLPTGALILFIQMKDGNFRLCINYQGFNNLTIKNLYLFPLIGESLNRLGRAKCFT